MRFLLAVIVSFPRLRLHLPIFHSYPNHNPTMAQPRSGTSVAQMPEASRVFSTYTNPLETQSTVIIGAGIIGCATAYYLSHSGNTKPDTIHLVEASPKLFASASGKAGGLSLKIVCMRCIHHGESFCWIEADVCVLGFGPATASLGSLSYRLHRELAEQHDGQKNWGYNRSTATSLSEGSGGSAAQGEDVLGNGGSRSQEATKSFISGGDDAPGWLTRGMWDKSERISEVGGVAQVYVCPVLLYLHWSRSRQIRLTCLQRSIKTITIPPPAERHERRPPPPPSPGRPHLQRRRWRHVRHSHPTRTRHRSQNSLHSSPHHRRCMDTARLQHTFPASPIKLGIQQLAGHSLVVKSPRWTQEMEKKGCHAVFTSMRSGLSPELFSRTGEEIYIAGLNDPTLPLPDLPADAQVDQASINELTQISERLLGTGSSSDLQVMKESLCFRPVTRKGVPIMSRVQDKDLGGIETKPHADGGVFVAAGHGQWGISQSLGSGKCMAEMLEGGVRSADVGALGLR